MENILRQDEIQMTIHSPITLWHFYQELEPQKPVKMKASENQHLEMAPVSVWGKDDQDYFFLARLRKFLGRKLGLQVGTSEMKHTLFLTKHFLRLFESCNVLFSGASKFLCFACAHLDRPLAQSRHYCFSKNRARILWALSSSHSAQNSDLLAPKLTQARATLMPLAVILTG